jgi:hypothetical protein
MTQLTLPLKTYIDSITNMPNGMSVYADRLTGLDGVGITLSIDVGNGSAFVRTYAVNSLDELTPDDWQTYINSTWKAYEKSLIRGKA